MGNLFLRFRLRDAVTIQGICGILAFLVVTISSPVLAREVKAPQPIVNATRTAASPPAIFEEIAYQPTEVDLALVLAIDISKSISGEEHRLQLDGYARAFRDSAILDAIAAGSDAAIAVT